MTTLHTGSHNFFRDNLCKAAKNRQSTIEWLIQTIGDINSQGRPAQWSELMYKATLIGHNEGTIGFYLGSAGLYGHVKPSDCKTYHTRPVRPVYFRRPKKGHYTLSGGGLQRYETFAAGPLVSVARKTRRRCCYTEDNVIAKDRDVVVETCKKYEVTVYPSDAGGIREEWRLNGKYHREDGPAIVSADGYKAWYVNGEQVSEEEHRCLMTPPLCANKVVKIDGKKYRLEPVD